MIRTFRRRANNYKSFRAFYIVSLPIMFLFTLLPVYVFLTEDNESNADIAYLVGAFVLLLALTMLCIVVGKKQLRTKKAYMEMTQPILSLNETGLIYYVNEREQYAIPWSQVAWITRNAVIDKYQNKIGYVTYISPTKPARTHTESSIKRAPMTGTQKF
ncbi:MAG: hypothetical protein V1761_03915 [bacterium]